MRIPLLHASSNFTEDKFSLDASGIAGFFGGEEAFASMISVHLIPLRRWLGWYNAPGSYFVAKKYGMLPNSTFWDGLFPGPAMEATTLLELDSGVGLRYMGVYSGTQLASSGHLSFLVSSYCKSHPKVPPPYPLPGSDPPDNRSKSMSPEPVPTAATQVPFPGPQEHRREITVTIAHIPDFEEWDGYPIIPQRLFTTFKPAALVFMAFTILFSLASTVVVAMYEDWFSFSMILFGVLSNGISCAVLGSGVLKLTFPRPSEKSPPGHGVLFDGEDIILLQGNERTISALLHSRFRLEFANDPTYQKIGLCSLILLMQFLLQLFLVPQGTLIGQIFFLATLAVSWVCNGYLASFDPEELQRDLLFKLLRGPTFRRFPVDKWSTGVAFATLFFRPRDPRGVLNEMMPNNTPAWALWKDCLCAAIAHNCPPSVFIQSPKSWLGGQLQMGTNKKERDASRIIETFEEMVDEDKAFLVEFLRQADAVYNSVPDQELKELSPVDEGSMPSKGAAFRRSPTLL